MKVEVQIADAVVPDRTHVVNVPVIPVTPNDMVPVGVIAVPGDVSVTTTLHVEPSLTTTFEVQEILVLVLRDVTVRTYVAELIPSLESPLYLLVMIWVPDPAAGA